MHRSCCLVSRCPDPDNNKDGWVLTLVAKRRMHKSRMINSDLQSQ
jgi:hypothetical protein